MSTKKKNSDEKELLIMSFLNNPIYELFQTEEIDILKNKVNIFHRFRYLFYSLKYKKRIIKWYWKSREKYIKEKYHPKNLQLTEEYDLDEVLENW